MIKQNIDIENLNLRYYIGIGCYKISYKDYLITNNLNDNDDKTIIDHFFFQLESLQNQFEGSTIQLFKEKYLINRDHLFIACYHVQKAFHNQTNIVNRKNLELLLYLSASRQINNAINAFGIDIQELITNHLNYCIITPKDNLHNISNAILKKFNGIEIKSEFHYDDIEKYNIIMNFFQINDDQIKIIINSCEESHHEASIELKNKYNALYELVCEKMVLLSLEKIKLDYT